MNTLEELLELAAKRGLTNLMLHSTTSSDGKLTYWHVQATPAPGKPFSVRSRDLVPALRECLTDMPKAPTPKPRFDSVSPPLSELPQREAAEEITAAVNEPAPDTLETWLPKA